MEGQTYPRSPDEAAWLELLASEPALFESSMAIGMRHWSPDVTCQLEAQIHWSRAANAIIERISSGCADSVAVLVAVATMAFGERLAGNIVTWGVHVDGLTHLLKQRLAQGHMTLSIWIYRIMIL